MKKLMDKHTIIRLKQEGTSNKQIAKEMGIDRKTVARYWNEFQEALITLSDPDEEYKTHPRKNSNRA